MPNTVLVSGSLAVASFTKLVYSLRELRVTSRLLVLQSVCVVCLTACVLVLLQSVYQMQAFGNSYLRRVIVYSLHSVI